MLTQLLELIVAHVHSEVCHAPVRTGTKSPQVSSTGLVRKAVDHNIVV